MVTRQAMEQLEAIVDRHGLAETLEMLAYVSGEKEDHIATEWQDYGLARSWAAAVRAIASAEAKVRKLRL